MAMPQIKEMRPTHDGVLDVVLAHPHATLAELGRITGYSVSWLSMMMRSDCFKAEYDRRRGDIEAECMQGISEKLNALAHLAIDKAREALEGSADNDFKLDAFDKILHRAGYAPQAKAAPAGAPVQVNNYVLTKEELSALRGQVISEQVAERVPEQQKALPNEPST